MKRKQSNQFHIHRPFYSAWRKYGWNPDDYGIGLHKGKIDKLAKDNATCIISYGKSDQEYTIKAKKVQMYPIENIKESNVKVYVVQRSALNYRKKIPLTPLMEYNIYLS